jgi:hypothetical protein
MNQGYNKKGSKSNPDEILRVEIVKLAVSG